MLSKTLEVCWLQGVVLLNDRVEVLFQATLRLRIKWNYLYFQRTIQTEKEKQTEEERKAASDMFSDDFTPTLATKGQIRGSDSQDPSLQVGFV